MVWSYMLPLKEMEHHVYIYMADLEVEVIGLKSLWVIL